MTIEFIDNRNRFFEDVKALERKNSATLGFMPAVKAVLGFIRNGLECVKAKMKLSVLHDNKHTDAEKENCFKQIDIEIHQTEEIMKHDLEYRGLLIL